LGSLKVRDQSVDEVKGGRMLLKRVWTEPFQLRMRTAAGSCGHGNEISGSIKD
jgi:hypothetical protein